MNLIHKDLWEISDTNNIDWIITIKKEVNQELLNKLPNVKFVAVAFTWYDSVDIDYCTQRNISVFNVPWYSTDAVAELALWLSISLLRQIPQTSEIIKSWWWTYPAWQELRWKSVGIVWTWTIWIRTAELFKAFWCEIYWYSRSENIGFLNLWGNYLESLEELFSTVDIVSLHVPHNKETTNLIDSSLFKLMKKSSYFINTARWPIVNEKDLFDVLYNKWIAWAAIDVFAQEPINNDNQLLSLNNILLTPHIAYKTVEALQRRAAITINNIAQWTNKIN